MSFGIETNWKDEILNGEAKYRKRKNGQIIDDNFTLEQTTPAIQEPTPLNRANLSVPIGEIKMFSSQRNDEKYLLCDGSIVRKNDFPLLLDKLHDSRGKVEFVALDALSGGGSSAGLYNTSRELWADGNEVFATYGGENAFLYSDNNGRSFEAKTISSSTKITINKIIKYNGKYFAFGRTSSDYLRILVSTDLMNWEIISIASTEVGSIKGDVVFGDNFVAIQAGNTTAYSNRYLIYSTDGGTTWVTGGTVTSKWYSMCYFKNTIYASTASGTIYKYDFGANTWTKVTTTGFTISNEILIGKINDKYMYLHDIETGKLYRTSNGTDFSLWTNETFTSLLSKNTETTSKIFLTKLNEVYEIKENEAGTQYIEKNFVSATNTEFKLTYGICLVETDETFVYDNGNGFHVGLLYTEKNYLLLPKVIDEANQVYGYIKALMEV